MEISGKPTATGTGTGTGERTKHVAVFAFPFASHPSLLLTVVRRLSSTTPTVIFSFFCTQKFNHALFPDGKPGNIVPYNISDGLPEGYVPGKLHEDVDLFLGVAESEFRKAVKAAEKDIGLNINCLVVDAFLWFSAEFSVPWVAFWTAGACSLSTHFYTELIRQKYHEMKGSVGLDDEVANLIPGLSAGRLGDLPGGIIFGDLESPFATMPIKMARVLTKATAVFINSFEELDPDLTKNLCSTFNKFLNIGPFNLVSKEKSSKPDEFSCISWLDDKKPGSVAYISFGTVCIPSPQELVALAEALEATKTPFIWSIKKDSQKYLPSGFLDRTTGWGKVVPWAPQVQVLEHVAIGVFVTHGGWNSVLESIVGGVPMICRPFYGDQPINAWMVERVWGIGVRVEGGNFTKQGTCNALNKVFSIDGSSKGLKKRTETLKDLAHKAVGPNGSSYQNFKTLVDVVTGGSIV